MATCVARTFGMHVPQATSHFCPPPGMPFGPQVRFVRVTSADLLPALLQLDAACAASGNHADNFGLMVFLVSCASALVPWALPHLGQLGGWGLGDEGCRGFSERGTAAGLPLNQVVSAGLIEGVRGENVCRNLC